MEHEAQKYPNPPIVEAALDFRLRAPLTPRERERARDHFKADYPTVREEYAVEVRLNVPAGAAPASVRHRPTKVGYRLIGAEGSDLLIVRERNFVTSRLAPYEGWQSFSGRALQNIQSLRKLLRPLPQFDRIGLRYINRFDLETSTLLGQDLSDFFNIGVKMADSMTTEINSYSLTLVFPDKTYNNIVRINSGISAPVLIDRTSITLDIDVSFDRTIPSNIDDQWELVERLRNSKNRIFEQSITDKLRGIIL